MGFRLSRTQSYIYLICTFLCLLGIVLISNYHDLLVRASIDLRSSIADTSSSDTVEQSRHAHPRISIVIARTQQEDISWLSEELGDLLDISIFVYTVDNPTSSHPVPRNKGHEAMVYLTHIIDNYEDKLDDIILFLHAHRFSWHNNVRLDLDAAKMVRHLNAQHVLRSGYMNLRCHHDPGCPAHIFPPHKIIDPAHPEAAIMDEAWAQLFPNDSIPDALAQPCCSQMAVTGEQISALPLQRYVQLQKWLLETELEDGLSGRVFEYIWQFIWGKGYQHCPPEDTCYCEGYGMCRDLEQR